MSEFDPYLKWLGIREGTRPINHYRLLGLEMFESDLDVISMAADRQMTHIRTYQNGPNGDVSQQILNELRARRCLLIPEKKAEYDDQMRVSMQQPTPPVRPLEREELAPPTTKSPPPLIAEAVDVDVVEPELVDSGSESKIGITEGGNTRKSTRRRERKQLVWSLFGWITGGLAAIGIGAGLIGSGLLPNSNSASGPEPEPKVVAAGPGRPVDKPATGYPKLNPGSTTREGTDPRNPPFTNPEPKTNAPIRRPKTSRPKTRRPKTVPPGLANGEDEQTKPKPKGSAWNNTNLAKYPKANSETRDLLKQIAKLVKDRTGIIHLNEAGDKVVNLVKDENGTIIGYQPSVGANGPRRVTVTDKRGALLIGLAVTTDDDRAVRTVQPVFLGSSKNAYLGGKVGSAARRMSEPNQPLTFSIAKSGYAVGELQLSVLEPIRCLRIKYMRITKDGLNPADFYWSQWVGTESGPVKIVPNSRGIPIIGFDTRFVMNSGIATLGLVGADESAGAISNVPTVTTNIPLNPGGLDPKSADPVESRVAIPSKREIDKAMDVIDREYRDSIVAIRSIRDLRRVSQKLISDGRSEPDDTDGRYARFEKARILGIWFGDAKTAVEALRAIDEHFEIEFWKEILETIEDAELKANTDTQTEFKRTMDELVDEAIDDKQFGPAGRLIANASLMAKRARDVAAQDKYKNLRKQVVELDKLTQQAEKARGTLLTDPNDPEANLSQGDYLFVVADESDAAFDFWKKSNVKELKDLIKKETSVDKRDGNQLVTLAADWHEMGKDDRSARDRKCLERARIHYRTAYGLLSGLERKTVMSKIKELDQILN